MEESNLLRIESKCYRPGGWYSQIWFYDQMVWQSRFPVSSKIHAENQAQQKIKDTIKRLFCEVPE